jgi:hypothetical protein
MYTNIAPSNGELHITHYYTLRMIVMSYHLADGIVYSLQCFIITAYAVRFDVSYDIECCEFHNWIIRIIVAVIVNEVSLNLLIFKLCLPRTCVIYRS